MLRVEEPLAREFYVKQCQAEHWSTRELERQIHSMLFERLALSRDKEGALALACEGQRIQQPADLLRDPYVFEFLDLPEPTSLRGCLKS
jgi:predicted nuclease of restriction endonuclease-like (RecB) superfamily